MITPEQFTALLGALGVVIAAVTALLVQVRSMRADMNGKLGELVTAKQQAATKEGELLGRDYERQAAPAAPQPPEPIA